LLSDRIATPLKMSSTRIKLDNVRKRDWLRHTGDGRPTASWDLPVLAAQGDSQLGHDLLRLQRPSVASQGQARRGHCIPGIHQKPLATRPAMGLGWHVTPMARTAQRPDGWIPLDDPDQPENQDRRLCTERIVPPAEVIDWRQTSLKMITGPRSSHGSS